MPQADEGGFGFYDADITIPVRGYKRWAQSGFRVFPTREEIIQTNEHWEHDVYRVSDCVQLVHDEAASEALNNG